MAYNLIRFMSNFQDYFKDDGLFFILTKGITILRNCRIITRYVENKVVSKDGNTYLSFQFTQNILIDLMTLMKYTNDESH